MSELLLADEVYAIIGAAMEVYYQLGVGFLEPVYQEAFEIELTRRRIPFEAQKRLAIYYKGERLRKEYVADVVCYDKIVIEIKAMERLGGVEVGQILNYLKVTRMPLGLLINFGSRVKLEWKRFVL